MKKTPRYYSEDVAIPLNAKHYPKTAVEIMSEAWISTGERLPGVYKTVLAVVQHEDRTRAICVGHRASCDHWSLGNGDGSPCGPYKVTHWMSLPLLPGGGQ